MKRMPFPLAKLAYMAIRQISKPLAVYIKKKAKTTPFLRNYILLPPAQIYHKFDTTIKLRILGMGRVKDVKPMSEEAAIELSSDMLGELIIFSVGAGCIYLEYRRQMKRDQNKENYQNSRIQELESTVGDLGLELEMQKAQIAELRRALTSQPVPQIIRDPQSGRVLQVEKR